MHAPLRLLWLQKLYNFFAADVSPHGIIACKLSVRPFSRVPVALDMGDEICNRMYFFGFRGGYEPETTAFLRNNIRDKKCFFDIGANVGYYTLLAAEWMQQGSQIHAFEPSPEVFQQLQRTVRHARGAANIHLSSTALSNTDGKAAFYLPTNGAWTLGSLTQDFSYARGGTPIQVPTTRLDTYCHTHGVPRIDLIKMDVEGAEKQVLEGMGDLLSKWAPAIICEVLDWYGDALEDFFGKLPYRKYVLTPKGAKQVDRIKPDAVFRDYYLEPA